LQADVTFAPGLFQAIQSPAAPAITWFKSLPGYDNDGDRVWGVYLLVLEKSEHTPKLYTGSGTNAQEGVKHRFNIYDQASRGDLKSSSNELPVYVKKALADGYNITSKGLLVTGPIPSAEFIPMARCLFLALESAFTFMMWTLITNSAFAGMVAMCL
jgi:hypothetical protein